MRLRALRWYEASGVLLLGALVGSASMAHFVGRPKWLADIGGQTWSGWVQAIGSIAAIWFSIRISRRDSMRALKVERLQIKRAMQEDNRRIQQALEEESLRLVNERNAAEERRQAAVKIELSKVDAVIYLCEGVIKSYAQCLDEKKVLASAGAFTKYCESAQKQAGECMRAVDQVPVYLPPYSTFAPEIVRLRQVNDEIFAKVLGISKVMAERSKDGALSARQKEIFFKMQMQALPLLEAVSRRLKDARARAAALVEGQL